MPTPEVLSYAAGIIDGEGCICIPKRRKTLHRQGFRFSVVISVTNTKEELIQWFGKHFVGGNISVDKMRRNQNANPSWRWTLVDKSVTPFLLSILPYLILKRKQAELALEFRRRIGGNRHLTDEQYNFQESSHQQTQKLNQKGIRRAREASGNKTNS